MSSAREGVMFGDLPERFTSKIRVNEETGCWEWEGTRRSDGYGVFGENYRTIRAHRRAYEVLVGPVPEGLVLDHLCRVRHCVNPDHLEPVTIGENVMRGETIASAKSAQVRCVRGHLLEGDNVILSKGGQRKCRECANARLRELRSRLDPEDAPHGTEYGYTFFNCRCPECRQCAADARARRLADKQSRLHEAPHGTMRGYRDWGCRCDACVEVQRVYNRERYARRRAKKRDAA